MTGNVRSVGPRFLSVIIFENVRFTESDIVVNM